MAACEPIGWPWGVHGGDSNTQRISSLCNKDCTTDTQ